MNITLIGMPGAGKSSVGKLLASELGYTFIDPDTLIEAEYGKPLQEILEELGDETFVRKESEVTVRSTRGRNRSVIATGGSAVYDADLMDHLGDIGPVLYLEVPLAIIQERIGAAPRGVVGATEKSLQELFLERELLYKRYATETVDASGTVEQVVDRVRELLEKSAGAL